MALALGAGAPLSDMELVQFHPSGMVWPLDLEGTLVTEAVRGEGGRLLNRHGERFMARYDPERMELSTRDRVALANYTEIVAGRGTEHGGVWLDVSDQPVAMIRERLPHMVEQFAAVGVDITREPMEVAPTAHYSMGGIQVTPATHATVVPGLFAAGEVTAGVHGANRLGGNSLAEILVFGRIAGEHAATFAAANTAPPLDEAALEQKRCANRALSVLHGGAQRALIDDLQQTMWQGAGVVRDADGLKQALDRLAVLRREADAAPSGASDLAAALDLRSMLLTAEATVRSALLRTESRGAHQRSDYPATDPAWQRTIVVYPRLADWGRHTELALGTEAIPDPSPEVSAALDATEIEVAGRLVE
jgi:succinate dehydrogenase / fumarate reductase flavoprotein subunit